MGVVGVVVGLLLLWCDDDGVDDVGVMSVRCSMIDVDRCQ